MEWSPKVTKFLLFFFFEEKVSVLKLLSVPFIFIYFLYSLFDEYENYARGILDREAVENANFSRQYWSARGRMDQLRHSFQYVIAIYVSLSFSPLFFLYLI